MKISANLNCACNSNKKYKKCCKPFHEEKLPKTAVELMRSRYCAFAVCDAEYIMNTTHFTNPEFTHNKESWKQDILNFCEYTDFEDLEILESSEDKDEAFVTFRATLLQNGLDASFTEKSRFKKVDGKWYYVDGIFL